MKILALDLSTKSTGWAVYENAQLIDYGCITASSNDLIKRIQKIVFALIQQVLNKHKIVKVIVEEVHPEEKIQNLQTHRALMWLQGAVAMMLHEIDKNIKIEYLYPSEWRKLCGIKTGAGVRRETVKESDIKFVNKTFGISVNDDIADAISIGYAYNQKELNNTSDEFNFGV